MRGPRDQGADWFWGPEGWAVPGNFISGYGTIFHGSKREDWVYNEIWFFRGFWGTGSEEPFVQLLLFMVLTSAQSSGYI